MTSDEVLISELTYGWGNDGWSASKDYLRSCVETALRVKEPILECGSGLTTILLGIIAQQSGNAVWTLEHDSFWGDRVDRYLRTHAIHSVKLCVAGLRDYGDFSWYNPPLDRMPDDFGLVVCDGPPSGTRGGRYGLLPVMERRLSSGCIVLLDDAQRGEERAILTRWAEEFNAWYEIKGSNRAYASFVIRARRDSKDMGLPRS